MILATLTAKNIVKICKKRGGWVLVLLLVPTTPQILIAHAK